MVAARKQAGVTVILTLTQPDANIDHRRVPNLMVYFQRADYSQPVTQHGADYLPGDVVAWNLGGGILHIGIVSDRRADRRTAGSSITSARAHGKKTSCFVTPSLGTTGSGDPGAGIDGLVRHSCRRTLTSIKPQFTVGFAPHECQAGHRPTARIPPRFPERRAPLLRCVQVHQARAGTGLVDQPQLSLVFAGVTVIAGALPSAVAYIGARILDSVIAAGKAYAAGGPVDVQPVVTWVLAEAATLVLITAAHRGITLCQALFKAKLAHRVNVMILDKALTLELTQFEDSEFYDKLTRARREASSRPLSLVMRTSLLLQNAISIATFSALLAGFSPWAVIILVFGGLPAFFAETKFSGDAFRLFRWREPETRMQTYLETAIAREDHAKEVKLFDLGNLFLGRYKAIYEGLYIKDRDLTVRREAGCSHSRCSASPRCMARMPGAPSRRYAA